MPRQEWVGIEPMGEVFLLTFLFIGLADTSLLIMSVFTVALISEPHSTVQTRQPEGGAPSSAYFAGEQQSLCETHPVCQHRLVFLWRQRLAENLRCPDVRRHNDAVVCPLDLALG